MAISITLNNIIVEYPVLQSSRKFADSSFVSGLVGGLVNRTGRTSRIRAINELSLNIEAGERIGLIGHNGSGKTTLLRVLAGALRPTSGKMDIQGRLVPLIDKGVGISELLTAEENIELPMRLLGASSSEIEDARASILEFTDLGDYAQLPVRMYSAGMSARLAFAISTAVKGDILLLDEWLGAGDLGFVEKATQRLNEFVKQSKILILASHSLELITSVCTRVLWFDHGQVIRDGDPEETCRAYWKDARTKQLEAIGMDQAEIVKMVG